MNNVITLRKSKFREACEEVEKMNPDVWCIVGMNNKDNQVQVIGNESFDIIQMYGMLEYAKTKIEPRSYDEPPKRVG